MRFVTHPHVPPAPPVPYAQCRYEAFLFSKPDTLLAWVSYPVVRIMQLRYVNDSVKAMTKALKA